MPIPNIHISFIHSLFISQVTMSESETTSGSKRKVIRGSEAGRSSARWEKVIFALDEFLVLKG